MKDTMTQQFPTDEQFTPEFARTRGVKLSVEIAYNGERAATDVVDRPSFFYWHDDGAVFLVDFNDGFSPALGETLSVALAMLESTGLLLAGKTVHWRDADKIWHTLDALQVNALLLMPGAMSPVAA